MTIDVQALRDRLRAFADAAARDAVDYQRRGDNERYEFAAGRQAAFLTSLNALGDAEDEAFSERDRAWSLQAEAVARRGTRVDMSAVERLEEFARHAGGAVDMASGTVYSDADGGL